MEEMMPAQKPRYEFIDLAKGLCIFLVVFYHFSVGYEWNPSFDTMLTSFRMPLYFCLSGIFFNRYDGVKDFIRKKTNKLLLPFVSFYLISYILCMLKSLLLKRPLDLSSIISVFSEDIPFNEALWFLMCLYFCGLLFYLLVLFSDLFKNNIIVLIVSSAIIGLVGFEGGKYGYLHLPLWLDSALTALPFYTFGFLIRNYTGFLQTQKYSRMYILLAAGLLLCAYIFGDHSEIRVNDMAEANISSYYLCGIAGTMAILLISKRINRLPVLSYCGRYSICILVTHVLCQKLFLYSLIFNISSQYGISYAIVAFAFTVMFILLSNYVLIPLMIKYLPHICAQKDVWVK